MTFSCHAYDSMNTPVKCKYTRHDKLSFVKVELKMNVFFLHIVSHLHSQRTALIETARRTLKLVVNEVEPIKR